VYGGCIVLQVTANNATILEDAGHYRFVELLFRYSEAHRLSLKIYAGRYEVIATRDAAEILREAIEKHISDSDQQAIPEDSKQANERGDCDASAAR
jgi:hypothetical protein